MKKFMAIYRAPSAAMDEMKRKGTPESHTQEMEGWMKWMEAKKASIVEVGAPLGKTKRATAAGVTDARNDIGGYTVVQAESADEAAALFTDNPMLMGIAEASVEVMEIMPMPNA